MITGYVADKGLFWEGYMKVILKQDVKGLGKAEIFCFREDLQ